MRILARCIAAVFDNRKYLIQKMLYQKEKDYH